MNWQSAIHFKRLHSVVCTTEFADAAHDVVLVRSRYSTMPFWEVRHDHFTYGIDLLQLLVRQGHAHRNAKQQGQTLIMWSRYRQLFHHHSPALKSAALSMGSSAWLSACTSAKRVDSKHTY